MSQNKREIKKFKDKSDQDLRTLLNHKRTIQKFNNSNKALKTRSFDLRTYIGVKPILQKDLRIVLNSKGKYHDLRYKINQQTKQHDLRNQLNYK